MYSTCKRYHHAKFDVDGPSVPLDVILITH
jgi:hypothetical protein